MSNRKFFAFLYMSVMLFIAVFGTGCGGGGGSGKSSPASCTITFVANGGSSTPSIIVSKDSTAEQPEDPSREGYIFAGWYRDNGTFAEPFAFGADGETISSSVTLYAQWIDDNPAGFAVDDALAMLSITYAEGDNPGCVTQNLGLPSSSEGLPITWSSSNSGAVSPSGSVTRPSDGNAGVILTASASSGDFTAAKSFDLTVIQARTRTIDEAKLHEPVTPEDIAFMNESDDNFEITYSESDDILRHVDGRFTDVVVKNADDALDALQSIHEILGIDDPYKELTLFNAARDEFGAQYSFRQVHSTAAGESGETLEVYGRSVMVSANASGDTDFLSSSFIETGKLNDVYTRCTPEQAESAALRHYAGETGISVVSSDTRKIVYSLGSYEQEPVIAFIVRVTGTAGSEMIDDSVIVSGADLSIIRVMSNIFTWTITDSGRDELGERKTFPVTVSLFPMRKNLRDSGTPEIRIYNTNQNTPVRISYNSSWNDGHQISAYTNMRTVLKWWKDTFNRNSLDNKGMIVKLITHDTSMNDNACWRSSLEVICIGNIGNSTRYDMTRAMGLDTLTHETTHAVLDYSTGGLIYQNATGAIHDGYADIFGCLRDRDWKHGWRADSSSSDPARGITYFIDKTQCLRDAAETVTVNSISQIDSNTGTLNTIDDLYNMYKTVAPTRGNDNNGCHDYCRLVTHAAYLMHQDFAGSKGLTWYELGRVWYKSMSMGLDSTSDFHTVRRNVLRAAKQMGLNAWKLQKIKDAFNRIGVTVPQGVMRVHVVDADTWFPIPGANVQLVNETIPRLYDGEHTDANGYAVVSSDAGSYRVIAYASGYEPIDFRQYLPFNKMTDITIEMAKTGWASMDIYIRDVNMNPIVGANMHLYYKSGGIEIIDRDVTDSNGRYRLINVPAGYYTVRAAKPSEGYGEHKYNIAVSPGMNYVSERMFKDTGNSYTAYLYKGSRSFLDSHLKLNVSGWQNFHVSSENPTAYLSSGRQAAILYSYPSQNVECVNFMNFSGSTYVYYVHWDDASIPNWDSDIYVKLYYKNKYLRRFGLPGGNSAGTYWKVFTLNSGRRKDVNETAVDEPEAE